jgi:hypothetical protein
MQVWEHDGPAQLHFMGEDLRSAIEDGQIADLDGIVNSDNDLTTLKKETNANHSGERRPWLGAVIKDAPRVSLLWDELKNHNCIDLLDDLRITTIHAPLPEYMGNVVRPLPFD